MIRAHIRVFFIVCAMQTEACVADCSSALEADPGRVKAYFRRALAREQLGEDGDALRDAKRTLEVFLSSTVWALHRHILKIIF